LAKAGAYAQAFSSNKNPGKPYGLDPLTAYWIGVGYDAGARGVFGKAADQ
jgi:hypothetical protein